MTKTEALKAGLLADGWTPVTIARTGARAYTKRLKLKDSTDTIPAWAWVGGGATLRVCVGYDTVTKAHASPKRAARMIALGSVKPSTDNLLEELAGL